MSMNRYQRFPAAIKSTSVSILPADTVEKKTIFTADVENGSVVNSITITTDETVDNALVQLYLNSASVDTLLGTKPVKTLAGTNGVEPTLDLLRDSTLLPFTMVDENGNRSLLIPAGASLKLKRVVTVTAAKYVGVTVIGQDFTRLSSGC